MSCRASVRLTLAGPALLAGCGMVHRTAPRFPSLNAGFAHDGGKTQAWPR